MGNNPYSSEASTTLTKADLTAFKRAYKQYFGVELDDDMAKRELTQLVQFVELIYKPQAEREGS